MAQKARFLTSLLTTGLPRVGGGGGDGEAGLREFAQQPPPAIRADGGLDVVQVPPGGKVGSTPPRVAGERG
jgi:hypothetical protein